MITENLLEKATTASAVGAVASPIWLPKLADVSLACATAAPILGTVWLTFQIVRALRDEWRSWRGPR